VSSAGNTRHRLNLRGNRILNHAIHIAAVTQLRHDTIARTYYNKKIAEGKTSKEAIRALKRLISGAVYKGPHHRHEENCYQLNKSGVREGTQERL
jgi:transposase